MESQANEMIDALTGKLSGAQTKLAALQVAVVVNNDSTSPFLIPTHSFLHTHSLTPTPPYTHYTLIPTPPFTRLHKTPVGQSLAGRSVERHDRRAEGEARQHAGQARRPADRQTLARGPVQRAEQNRQTTANLAPQRSSRGGAEDRDRRCRRGRAPNAAGPEGGAAGRGGGQPARREGEAHGCQAEVHRPEGGKLQPRKKRG
jgi:hypothetical protein